MNDKDNIVELAVVMGTGTCPDIVEYYGCLIREVRRLTNCDISGVGILTVSS